MLSAANPRLPTPTTTLHIDAATHVTVRALVYRAQSPDSPHTDDGECRPQRPVFLQHEFVPRVRFQPFVTVYILLRRTKG
jgi:hypothetical protein